MTADGSVVLGYSHLGMLAAARWLMARTNATLIQALQDNPGYDLRIVGELRHTCLFSCSFFKQVGVEVAVAEACSCWPARINLCFARSTACSCVCHKYLLHLDRSDML
jgi:hypothetical protein